MITRVFSTYRAAFAGLPRDVWLLAIALAVNRSGTMVLPFLGLYVAEALHLGNDAAGLVLLAYGLGSVLGSWAGGRLSAALHPVHVQELSLIGAGFAYLAIIPFKSAAGIAAAVFVASAIADAFRPAVMSAAADAAPAPVRARSMALIRLAANLGMATGPALGGLLAALDYRFIFVGDALTCWIAAVVLWRTLHRSLRHAPPRPAAHPAAVAAHRDPGFLALLGLVLLMAIVIFQVFGTLPLYLHQVYGLAEQTIGLVLAVNAALIVALEMILVRSLEKHRPLRVMAVGALLAGAGLALLPLGRGAAFAMLTVVVWTFGEMLFLPFSNALAAGRARGGPSGTYMGLYSAAFAAAFVIAPPLGLWVFGRFGGDALWFGAGAVAAVLAAAAFVLAAVPGMDHPVEHAAAEEEVSASSRP